MSMTPVFGNSFNGTGDVPQFSSGRPVLASSAQRKNAGVEMKMTPRPSTWAYETPLPKSVRGER